MTRAEGDLKSFRMAGDWCLYAEACLSSEAGLVAYCSSPLNRHRRHERSVTHALDAEAHVGEVERIHSIIRKHLELPSAARKLQAKYIEELRAQFKLNPTTDRRRAAKPALRAEAGRNSRR